MGIYSRKTGLDCKVQIAAGCCMKPELVLGNKVKSCQSVNVVLEERAVYIIKKDVGGSSRRQRASIEGKKSAGRNVRKIRAL